ncbi:PAS-domain containing protein [Roseomonas sp. CAU 1739]|uniref:sensor histidine kinase n=1 Tax=Roseomonas sp. CAU 1739 TaxID=3140364 RepID=UPI00325B1BD2
MTPADAALRAIEALPHAILVVDGADRLVLANPALWGEAGADPARFPPGTPLRDMLRLLAFRGLLGAGDPAALAEQALAQDRGSLHLRHVRSADGARLSEVASLPLPGGGFMLCSVDITALNRAEAAARARAALLDHVLTMQRGGVALFDAAQRLVLHNPAYGRHIGATPEMLAGRPTLSDIMEALTRAGEFATSRDRGYVRAVLAADRRKRLGGQRDRLDGTVVRFHSTPEPDGGFLIESDEVTDLRHAEDEARRRAAILDGVLEALPHGICVWGPDRRVALFNDAYSRLMEGAPLRVGDTLEDVIQRRAKAGEYGPGEAEAVYRQEMARDLSRPQERRRLRANGTALDVRTAPLPDGGHISVVTEITALWRAEEEARHRARLLETAMGSMRHGLVVYGPDRRVIAANDLAGELAGHEPGAIGKGALLDDLVQDLHANGRLGPEPEASEVLRTAIALDRSKPHRMVRRTPAGRVLEVSSDPTPDGGFVVTHIDITARAEAEREAREHAAILQVMLENMRHGIALFDGDSRLVASNALAASMCGLPPELMSPGTTLVEMRRAQTALGEFAMPQEDLRADATQWTRPLTAPDRYIRRRPNGRIIEVMTDRTPDGGFVRTYTDVTDDRQVRDELERARAAAEAASEAKSRFLATMSHELRTPLSAVIGYAEALLTDPAPEQVGEYAGAVREAGRQVLALIDDILDVARAGGAEPSPGSMPVDPAALVAGIAAAIAAEAEAAGLTLTTGAAPDLPRAVCDERRLRRILQVVASNAVKFTPAGGRIRIEAAGDEAGGLVFRVSDTGIGMDPADIPRAFEPFTQLESSFARRYPGSGLGLHLARLLAETLGATLGLDSHPGRGTIATLRLPRAITISGPRG